MMVDVLFMCWYYINIYECMSIQPCHIVTVIWRSYFIKSKNDLYINMSTLEPYVDYSMSVTDPNY